MTDQKNGFPQLRVRTGMSFRKVYGTVDRVFDRLDELESSTVGMVDSNTWGHVSYEKAAAKRSVKIIYGIEVPIKESADDTFAPKAWVLAWDDLKAFYRLASEVTQKGYLTPEEFGDANDVIRFCGGAVSLLAPWQFDFVDLNPSSLTYASRCAEFAEQHDMPLVLTSFNDFPAEEDRDNAYAWEVRDAVSLRSLESEAELRHALRFSVSAKTLDKAVEGTLALAKGLKSHALNKAPIINVEGDLRAMAEAGKAFRLARGHIADWTPEYEERMQFELEAIASKNFDSYFIVVADLVLYAKKHMLVGPARGSSAGSLVCYLTQITEVDPIPFGLLFQRFIDVSRADFPDIDIDFDDTKRFMVFDYLRDKYGLEHVAKVGNVNTLQPLSSMAQVSKRFDIHPMATDSIRNTMLKYAKGDKRYGRALEDTLNTTGPGQEFRARHPGAAKCMGDLEAHPSHSGVHAAGILVCNDPISDYCTVNAEGIAQIDKDDAEYLNLLKIDALGLRTLGIISDSGVLTSEQLYSMRLDDPCVFNVLNEDKVSGVFQFEGDAVRGVTRQVNVDKFSKIDSLTALARPGPLSSGMAQKYVDRERGREEVEYAIPELEKHLSSTHGVIIYQEQVMSIVRELGQFDWAKTSEVRKAMAKSKGAEVMGPLGKDFVAGCESQGIDPVKAQVLWDQMCAFGAYGFNKSHAVAYGMVTYWTCYLKHYHKIEFAAACLREAKDDEQTIAILRELAKEGIDYTPIDPEFSGMNWVAADGRLIGGIMNARGFGAAKALNFVELRSQVEAARSSILVAEVEPAEVTAARSEMVAIELWEGETQAAKNRAMKPHKELIKAWEKQLKTDTAEARKVIKRWESASESLKNAEIQYADLQEAHSLFGKFYDNPSLIGVTSGKPIINIIDAEERETVLIIGKMVKKTRGDLNDPTRVARRGGQLRKGKTIFLDMFLVDDSVDSAVRFRVGPELFDSHGRNIHENVPTGSWFLIRGWKLEGIDMFNIKAIKRIEVQ